MSKLKKVTKFTYFRWKFICKICDFLADKALGDSILSRACEEIHYLLVSRIVIGMDVKYGIHRETVCVGEHRFYNRDVIREPLDKEASYVTKILKEYPEYTI